MGQFDEKLKKQFPTLLEKLSSGDVQGAMKFAGGMDRYFAPLAQRMVYDYGNLGGLSPETKAAIAQFKTPKAAKDEDYTDMRNLLYPVLVSQMRNISQQMPQVTGTGGDKQVQLFMRPPDVPLEDFMRMHIYNVASQYQDPTTKAETMQYLARENPFLFRGYSNVAQPPTPIEGPGFAAQAAGLTQAAGAIDYDKLFAALPGGTQAQLAHSGPSSQEARSAMNWLRNYLTTAAEGMGGTRAQQQFAQGRIKTMEEEAKSRPDLANWLTLGQNMVNPVMMQSTGESGFGQARALQPPPDASFVRRGVRRGVGLL
jgi:hypothetical protein